MSKNKNSDFFVIIADEEENGQDLSAFCVMRIEKSKFLDMAFKYDVTEFCTAIKPFGFRYFFEMLMAL